MAAAASLYVHELPSDLEWVNCEPVSLSSFRGRMVLLHFWTASSIHCKQALAEVRQLEQKYADSLVVIGVHTPKFSNEADSSLVLKSVNRWFVRHPVINDSEWRLWRRFAIAAWPSFVLLDPEGRMAGVFVGEGQRADLEAKMAQIIDEANTKRKLIAAPAPVAKKPEAKSFMQFPSKLASFGERLYIADTAHNRVLETTFEGRVTRIFGSGNAGFWDGLASQAGMREPTGLCVGKESLFICDTGNHAVRRVKLLEHDDILETIAGTGKQGVHLPPNGKSKDIDFASPTDCVFANEKLYVCMTGHHQIWALDLLRHTAERVAGGESEGTSDGTLMAANFAQPMSLALAKDGLFVLDAAGSSLRHVRLSDGLVSTIVGSGLFESGDSDGPASLARLKFPSASCFDAQRQVLWIADSYNNKIKIYSPAKNEVKTLNVNYKLSEPAGLTIADNALWIANQNAHELLRLDLKTGRLNRVAVEDLRA
jgi:thiol-disulfide isomerase/thioredoxin